MEARFFRQRVNSSGTVVLVSQCIPCAAARAERRFERNGQSQAAQMLGAEYAEQTCRGCNELLPLMAFRTSVSHRSGFDTVSRDCRSFRTAKVQKASRELYGKADTEHIPAPATKVYRACGKKPSP